MENLQRQIDELKMQIDAMYKSSTIPFNVERSLIDRGFVQQIQFEEVDPLAYDTLNTLVPTPEGDVPVIAFPIRWMKITNTLPGNKNYIIPAYTADNP